MREWSMKTRYLAIINFHQQGVELDATTHKDAFSYNKILKKEKDYHQMRVHQE